MRDGVWARLWLRDLLAIVSLAALAACGGGDDARPAAPFTVSEARSSTDFVAMLSGGATNCGSGLSREKFDLNGDGKADLLWYAASAGQTAAWLMNGASNAGGVSLLTDPNYKVIGTPDVNGDGKCDLLWHNAVTGQTAIWLMDGTTVVASAVVYTDLNYKVIATPDLNGDGKSDLLWYNALTGQTVAWLMNGMSPTSTVLLFTDSNYKVTATPDLNGDGRSDLLWYNAATGQTAAWLMNGTSPTSKALLFTDPNYKVTATPDLNGDGKSDLLWYNALTGQTVAWLMNGLSATSTALLFTDPTYKVTATPDLNGDGKSDLLWYNAATGQTAAWLMNGTSPTSKALLYTDPNYKVVATPDLNGDGKSDLLWYNAATGQTATWLMNGTSSTSTAVLLTHPDYRPVTRAISGGATNCGSGLSKEKFDLNGDGKADLLWYAASAGQTVTWLMNGASNAGGVSLLTDPNYKVIGTPDVNGDGKCDLLWHNAVTGQTAIWLMDGTTVIGSAVVFTDPNFKVIATPDLNGDGKSDLLWYNALTGQTVAWLMNGLSPTSTALLFTDPNYKVIATPDLNDDGKSDLLWYNALTGQTVAWLMNGLSATSTALLFTDPNYKVTATPDLNGDGKSDLLWYNAATGQTVAWLMNGLSATSTALLFTDPNYKVIATPDLNGDGKSDLLWYNAATGQTAAWLMNGTSPISTALLFTDPNYKVVATPDLNGDGKSDLLWYNAVTGQTTTWLMNGTSSTSTAVLLTHPDFRPVTLGLTAAGGTTGVGPFAISGSVNAADISAVDSDTNDPAQLGRANNNSLQTAQASGNPALIVGYVNQPGTGPAGANYASGDLWDVYSADLVAGQVVELNFGNATVADLDLFIFDSSGNTVGSSIGVSRSECVLVRRSGRFLIGVNAYSGSSTYELAWGPPRPSSTCPNATPAQAGALPFVPGEIVAKPGSQLSGSLNARALNLAQGSGLSIKASSSADAPVLLALPSSAAQRADALQRLQSGGRAVPLAASGARAPTIAAPIGLSEEGRLAFDTIIAVKLLQSSAQFAYAELNLISDPAQVGYGAWPPNDGAVSRQPHLGLIQLPQAFDALNAMSPRPSYTPIVAVVDTGIVADHPDIRRMLVAGYDFVSDATRAGDGGGIDPNPDDASQVVGNAFHGTHVAGTIAAETFNGDGVVGVAPMARIMPVRVLGATGSGTSFDIVQGIRFAAGLSNSSGFVPAKRADVINMSLGGAGSCPSAYADVIAQARSQGSIIVAAAGNDGGAAVSTPANCPGAIAVSAIAYEGTLAKYSNLGPEIALTAPGGDSSKFTPAGPDIIWSLSAALVTDSSGNTTRQPTYRGLQGTSMATPHVAGVLALMRALNPAVSPTTIDALIASGAISDDVGAPGRDNQFGYGRINALKAVLAGSNQGVSLPTLQLSPSLLDFGSTLTQLPVVATQVNGSSDTVAQYLSHSTNPAAIRLFTPAGGNPAGGPFTFYVTLDRALLALGENVVSVELITQQGRRYPFVVSIAARQTFAPSQRGVGPLYVLALDADNPSSPTLVTAVSQSQTPAYAYTLNGIRVPRVIILAGPDLDNDGYVCGSMEPCGAFLTLENPTVLTLAGNRSGVNFSIVSGATSASLGSSGNTPGAGYPRGP